MIQASRVVRCTVTKRLVRLVPKSPTAPILFDGVLLLMLLLAFVPLGVLILRRAVWVIIMEQGYIYSFVPAAHSWLSGFLHLGLIWGSVMHPGVFLGNLMRY